MVHKAMPSTVITFLYMRQTPTRMPGSLEVTDSRTRAKYQLPIHNNVIRATDLKEGGLRVHDPGLQNTTVVETGISVLYVPSSSLVGELTHVVDIMKPASSCSADTEWTRSWEVTLNTCCTC